MNELTQQLIHDTLPDVVRGVLADAAFLLPSSDASTPSLHGEVVVSEIEVQLPFSGTMRLFVPLEVGTELAANILAIDHAATDAQIDDAVGEMLNIVCGVLLERVDADASLRFSAPHTFRSHDAQPHRGALRFDIPLVASAPVTIEVVLS